MCGGRASGQIRFVFGARAMTRDACKSRNAINAEVYTCVARDHRTVFCASIERRVVGLETPEMRQGWDFGHEKVNLQAPRPHRGNLETYTWVMWF